MGKFNANQRAIIGANCISAIQSSGNKKRVMVYCSSKEAGQQVANTIQAAYPGYKCTKSENIFESIITHIAWGSLGPVGTAAGIATETWKNFSVNTGSQSAAKKLVTDLNDCIAEYGGAGDVQVVDDDPSANGSGLSRTIVYVIAGVVLAVVLAIVLHKKRKK